MDISAHYTSKFSDPHGDSHLDSLPNGNCHRYSHNYFHCNINCHCHRYSDCHRNTHPYCHHALTLSMTIIL